MNKPANNIDKFVGRFLDFCKTQGLVLPARKTLLAVSGGLDSMAMASLFLRLGWPFEIAHINYTLRGKDSDDDEMFVKKWAGDNSIKCHTTTIDGKALAESSGVSLQMAARDFRYEWLENTRQKCQCSYIATAHHTNDALETLLLNLVRGTGIAGLHGIHPKVGHLIRPMMFASREEIAEFAKAADISFRNDSSNQELKYTRNKIRHEVVPVLKEINPKLEETIQSNIEAFRAVEHLYLKEISALKKALIEKRKNDWYVPFRKLLPLKYPAHYLYECLRDFGFTFHDAAQALEMYKSQSGKMILSQSHRIIKHGNFLIITSRTNEASTFISVQEGVKNITFPEGKLQLQKVPGKIFKKSGNKKNVYVDAACLSYPLTLRPWKPGDYFYPFGMRKKKKISDFLTDEKIPVHDKERIWVLCSGERIAWVIGQRLDDRFKVENTHKEIVRLKWKQ